MLVQGDKFIEVVTWKRAIIGGIKRRWFNSYQFVTTDIFDQIVMENLTYWIRRAEQHMYPPDVVTLGALVWEWSQLEQIADKNKVYVAQSIVHNYRDLDAPSPKLTYEYALLWTKEVPYGRSGKLAYRGSLHESDCVPVDGASWAIDNVQPYGGINSFWAHNYLNNLPLSHVVLTRDGEIFYPTDARRVIEVKVSKLTKFQSIDDAQARKTWRAAPFQTAWFDALELLFESMAALRVLIDAMPVGLEKDDIPTLQTMAGILKGNFTSLLEYWDEGVKPTIMENWRPSSGLDPFSAQVHLMCASGMDGIDELGEILNDLIAYPDDPIPELYVRPFIDTFSWYMLIYERCGAMRFTGTPLKAGSVIIPPVST
jgi:hypothetical protein